MMIQDSAGAVRNKRMQVLVQFKRKLNPSGATYHGCQ